MATMKSLEAAVRRRYGKQAYVRHNERARDMAGREAAGRQLKANRERAKEIMVSTNMIRDSWKLLLKASAFVTDTDGDKTAVEELKKPVASAMELNDRLAEQMELHAEEKQLEKGLSREPYEIFDGSSGFFSVYVCGGDTIDQLLAKVSGSEVKQPKTNGLESLLKL